MERTLNQLMRELEEIAVQHRQLNGSFFQGDFYDAISRDAVQYPLMVVTLQPRSCVLRIFLAGRLDRNERNGFQK